MFPTLVRPIEVLIVDDQRAILAGVGALVDSEAPHLRVAGKARTGEEALRTARATRPDVIVLDADLGDEDGLALIPHFRACCDAAIVVFTGDAEPRLTQRARALGATRTVSKAASGLELLTAIRHAAA